MRSLRLKSADAYAFTSSCEFNIIALSETWLTDDHFSSEYFPSNYTVFRSDRDPSLTGFKRGGGVLLAVLDGLPVVQLDLSPAFARFPLIDIVGCKTMKLSKPLYIYVVYIHNSVAVDIYEEFLDIFEQFNSSHESVMLLGDFNITFFNDHIVMDAKSQMMSAFIAYNNYFQCNNIVNSYGRLLDLIISTFSSNEIISLHRHDAPMVKEDAHHPALEFECIVGCETSFPFVDNSTCGSYNFKKADCPALYAELLATDWSFLYNFNNIDKACDSLYKTLDAIFKKHVPIYVSKSSKYPSWFTREIINNLRLKACAHRRYKAYTCEVDYCEFKRLRALIKSQVKTAYERYIRGVEDGISSNPGQFWSYINGRRNTTRIGTALTDDLGSSYNTPEAIVNGFAKYFSSVYTSNSSDVFEAFSSFPQLHVRIDTLCESDVVAAIRKLKANMTSGPDGIPAFLVRDCVTVFTPLLTSLYNMALSNSRFPDIWKVARVCPILKSGSASMLDNYRPISILNNFAKVFEMALYGRIFPQVKRFISSRQHGFFEGRSTVSNLIYSTQYISSVLDNRGQVDVIYTDFSKAFDRIGHDIILGKLSRFGFSELLLSFFSSYLKGRQYFVQYNGWKSAPYLGTSGVPQGSNLGPLLFLLFINDVVDVIQCESLLYADDLKIFSSISSLDDCQCLQRQLDALHSWCVVNRLSLNVRKCRVVTYSRSQHPIHFPYKIHCDNLSRDTSVIDLGICFDDSLTFSLHLDKVVASSLRVLGFVVRNSSAFTDLQTIKTLFFSFVRSKLEYGAIVWNPYYASHKIALERVQRKFLKYLYFRKYGHYPSRGYENSRLCNEFDVPSLEYRRVAANLVFLYKLMNGLVDSPELLAYFNIRVPAVSTRCDAAFLCPQPRSNLMLKSPVYCMMSLFNKISTISCDMFYCSIGSLLSVIAECFCRY